MEMLSGAEMVVRSLIDQGVKQVFGYPGGAVLDIYDALHTVGGIDHILVRHEQAAVHMADGRRVRRGSGRGVSHVGPRRDKRYYRHCDRVHGLYSSGDPLRAGGNLTDWLRRISGVRHGRDIASRCEAQLLVKQTEDIRRAEKAFWLAASGRPGPVVVDLPKDILNPANKLPYVWPESVSMRSYNPTTQGHKGQIKRALQTLLTAKNRWSMSAVGQSILRVSHSFVN